MKPFFSKFSLDRWRENIQLPVITCMHSSGECIVVENTFGRLKAKWRQLIKQNDMEV